VNNQHLTSTPITRRDFLRRIAILGTMLVVPSTAAVSAYNSFQSSAVRSAQLHQPIRIGVLLPESRIAPNVAERLRQGFQLAIDLRATSSGLPIELIPQRYGVNPTEAMRRVDELITNRQVDIVSGLFSRNHTTRLIEAIEQHNIPLVVSDVGANLISTRNQHRLIARSSLGYWQAAFALGSWSAQQVGTRAAIATSFYESGYDTIHAFRAGFEQAGGQILATIVSDSPQRKNTDPTQALAEIASFKPDLVYAAYSGADAITFVQAYADSPLYGHIPLQGTAMLVEDQSLAKQQAALGIQSAAAWSPTLLNPQNQAFLAAYRLQFGQPADAIALLGYDTAQLIGATIDATSDPKDFMSALQFVSITSPRGPITFSSDDLESTSPIYLRETRHVGGFMQNVVLAELPAPTALEIQVSGLRTNPRSGWTNAYLAV
jgi:branched-chain amino acid transport system substrate-binding protein